MKKLTVAAAAALGAAALFAGGSGIFIMKNAAGGRRQTLDEAWKWQTEHYDLSWYDGIEKEEYTVSGYDEYVLHALLLKNPSSAGRYMILSHGYTDNRFGSLKYAKIYLDLGFSCILYDLRGHGENAPAPCTYGVLESKDLLAMVEDTRTRYGSDVIIGLHGESLGAATTVTALGEKPDVSFAVADCGFADIENVLKGAASQAHLPPQIVDLASGFSKLNGTFSYRDMQPVLHLKGNHIPVLFIHGASDTFIRPENSQRMYEATEGYRELHLIPGAGHAESVLKDPEEYAEAVRRFVEKVTALT